MKIEYTKQGDYYIPNIVAHQNIKNLNLGRYGRMRLKFLKEHKKAEYTILLMDNKLEKHLVVIDKIANGRKLYLYNMFISVCSRIYDIWL